MAVRAAEIVAIAAAATLVTVVMAFPVLQAPSQRLFGFEIVGRHHDPFTVMEHFARPISLTAYSQPVTDVAGAMLARVSNPVAAYNWLVLISFPLSAVAAYLLARYLALSPAGAAVAAMAFAFSPFHVAQAAYHPHIAQTQWLPLYVLALWRCLDDASLAAVALLCGAAVAVTLSNFYGGFIAVVITPVAVAAYWLLVCRPTSGSWRRLGVTVGTILVIAAAGVGYALYAARAVVVNAAALAVPREDLFRYSAKWWSYLVPPVEHPLFGALADSVWSRLGARSGLLEQQVSLGWGIIGLGLVAIVWWLIPDTAERRPLARARVPVLVAVAAAALYCSLSPERTIGSFTFVRPAALLFNVAPMFRAYARFGVVVQLMAALLAGIAVDRLRRAGTKPALAACVGLVALAAGEYAIAPAAWWRDVLPVKAHRWVMQHADHVRVLDCTPIDPESASVQWLTGQRVALLGGPISDCADPNLSRALVENGYTHLLVRRASPDGRWFADHPAPDGLRVAARFDDGEVMAVEARPATLHTAAVSGFYSRERDAHWAWRWMGKHAAWTIVNSGARPVVATLDLEISAFHRTRDMSLLLDGRYVQTIAVEPVHRLYQVGPLTVVPGYHELVFRPAEGPTLAGAVLNTGDRRELSFALGTWNWTVRGELP